MGLLAPLSILWLLPLGGVVVLLYLLKLRRKEKVVSSVFLWRQAVQDVQANAPFQKLRKNLLLFIQLGVLLLAIAALARPFARKVGLEGQNIVVVLDASASMKATDVGKSRIDEAKKLALGAVDRMGRGDSMLVITASARTRVVSSFTGDKKALAASISGLEAKDTRANLREAMVLALSLVARKKNPRIIVISDGGFAPVEGIEAGKAKISFLRVGKRSDNVGIVALDSRKTIGGAQQVFIGLRSFSDKPRTFDMEVYANGQLFDVREEALRPGEAKQEILSGLPPSVRGVTVKLDLRDDLTSDNSATVYLAPPRRVSVLLVTKGNLFLEHAFNLDPDTQVVKSAEVPTDLAGYDIIVFDGVNAPEKLPKAGYLIVNASCASAPARMGQSITSPTVAEWDRKHSVTSYVDFSGLRMSKARALSVGEWGQELIESDRGVIAACGENSGRRFVVIGWSLLDSDFPLRVGFPIFVTNCIEWLAGTRSEAADIAVRTGSVVPIEAAKAVTVVDPAGQEHKLSVTDGKSYFDATELCGVYKLKQKGGEREFACNLLALEESDIAPKGKLVVGEKSVTSAAGGIRTNREYWRVVLVLALGLVAFEWYAFHRRLG